MALCSSYRKCLLLATRPPTVLFSSADIRPLKTPEDCALAYADLLDDVGSGRLTPEEAQTISAIIAKRAELFPSIELATEIEALKTQLAAIVGTQRPTSPIRRSFAIA
jgi:hypothetical protein